MKLVHVELRDANQFVERLHRHHKPVSGHRFSIGCEVNGQLVGVAICGRPVARLAPANRIEVTRLCTDGTPNACSFLYGASARAAKALGYDSIQTYVLDVESAVSLRASGWVFDGMSKGGQWKHSDGRPRRTDQPTNPKQRWIRTFN